ncbi:MAG: hypothetical protein M1819_001361 [Sarea resinae]|nr:MAG: hypothetical protein M1819_001361 [Sarea resinae]
MASSSIRPSLSHYQPSSLSGAPHTPQRNISTTFSPSPSTSFRGDEDFLIFEFGARFFRAGVAGENTPRCILGFGPEEQRRVGDYRKWQPSYDPYRRKRKRTSDWGEEHELWRMDLRGVDLGLVEDKVERAVREAYTKYLLTDSRPRRLLLVLPPVMPHPLLDTLLSTLFSNFYFPNITLLPSPVLSAVGAGLRSALVVDIGWAETTVTGVFEYREVHHSWSKRAGRILSREMGDMLSRKLQEKRGRSKGRGPRTEKNGPDELSFEDCEEIIAKVGWCRSYDGARQRIADGSQVDPLASEAGSHAASVNVAEDESASPLTLPAQSADKSISIPLQSATPFTYLDIPFSQLADPIESAWFAADRIPGDLDDDEQPLHLLTYNALLALPLDVRGTCVSRIVITGGGANIPGVKRRIVDEVAALVQERGWDAIRGKAADEHRRRLKERSQNRQSAIHPFETRKTGEQTDGEMDEMPVLQPGLMDPEPDPTEEKLRREEAKISKPSVHGVVRGVQSLGSWAGGSLAAGLKVRGVVEIDRERYLQHGLAGANREAEVSVVPQRQSVTAGTLRSGTGDRSSWTLGIWA